MIDAKLRRLAMRMAALNAAAEAWEQWYNDQFETITASFGQPHEQQALLDAMTPAETAEFNRYYALAPSAETLATTRRVLKAMGEYFYNIDSRDRQKLAESRSYLLNALVAMEGGLYATAVEDASRAHKELHWLLYERKRGHERANHTLVPEHEAWERLINILADIDEVVDRLRQPARIPLGGVA